ncbi:DUF6090 family protein [Polaribacter sp.]
MYFKYAIGEIVLVVIGILIAMQINNWNENRKDKLLLKKYEQNLISELKNDLLKYDELDSLNVIKSKKIKKYLAYYNLDQPNLDTLIAKRDSLKFSISIFTSSTFTIQDLISTGNLGLFPNETKNAILKFQSKQQVELIYVNEMIKINASLVQEMDKYDDLLYRNKFSKKQHKNAKNWQYNLDSHFYLLDNNTLARFLTMYSYQKNVYIELRQATKELLQVLENKKEKV